MLRKLIPSTLVTSQLQRMTIYPFFIFLFLLTSVFARSWKIGDNGLVRWDNNCHFLGYVMTQRDVLSEDCGKTCISMPFCTHFTHAGRTCYLKRNTDGWRERDEDNNTCGFIPGRSLQPLRK
uniref:Apple domain-containing protein n=1 Tax=Daphnia galeata TaxID=27404 RepID=A0A8J2RNI6_9CRUS|nr:unnamed protein product [Daphnia galeata]